MDRDLRTASVPPHLNGAELLSRVPHKRRKGLWDGLAHAPAPSKESVLLLHCHVLCRGPLRPCQRAILGTLLLCGSPVKACVQQFSWALNVPLLLQVGVPLDNLRRSFLGRKSVRSCSRSGQPVEVLVRVRAAPAR